IEDRQRAEAAERGESEWQPKLFRRTRAGASQGPGDLDGEENLDWVIDATIDGKTPDEIVKQVLAIAPILPGQKAQAKSQPQPQSQPRQEAASAAPAPAAAPQPQQFQQAQPAQQMQTPQQYQPAPSSGSSNLVDFGHAGGVAPSQPAQQKASPLNTMSDLKEPLQPVIHRQDSVEGFDEEFHDADS
ncbi:hypothetical protein KCU67_g8629, partial [Aureobasidium melanogenum]